RPRPREPQLRPGLVEVVARDALALAPPPGLVVAEARPAHPLGVARGAAEVPVDQLSPRGRPRHPLGECGPLVVVVEGRLGAQLGVRAQDDARPRDEERAEEAEEEDRVALHGGGASMAEGGLKAAASGAQTNPKAVPAKLSARAMLPRRSAAWAAVAATSQGRVWRKMSAKGTAGSARPRPWASAAAASEPKRTRIPASVRKRCARTRPAESHARPVIRGTAK